MLGIQTYGVQLSEMQIKLAMNLYMLNYSLILLIPVGIVWVMRQNIEKLDFLYLIGLFTTFTIRTMFWIFETWGYSDKKYLLTMSFFIMIIYFILDKQGKLRRL